MMKMAEGLFRHIETKRQQTMSVLMGTNGQKSVEGTPDMSKPNMTIKIVNTIPFGIAYSSEDIIIASYETAIFLCSIGYWKCSEIYS